MGRAASILAEVKRSRFSVAGSVLFHLAVAWLIFHAWIPRTELVRMPGTSDGTRVLLTYSPGRARAQERAAIRDPKPRAVKRIAKRKVDPSAPQATTALNAPSPPSANPDAKSGNDALGSGDINIALLQFFPTPRPDLTPLPHGVRGDVVLDVVIDAQGRIVQLTKEKGVGYGVDEAVIATVQTWTFHPATRNGQPVASEQELLFHYEKS